MSKFSQIWTSNFHASELIGPRKSRPGKISQKPFYYNVTSPKLIWRVLKVHSGRAAALVTKKTSFSEHVCDHVLWGA